MEKKHKITPIKLFLIVTSAIIAAALILFVIIPIVFNLNTSIFSAKEETKLTTFSPEAFAYQLDKGWEVDASTRVKGFQQKKNNSKFTCSVSYSVDLVTTKNDTIKNVDSRVTDKSDSEQIMDIGLESQFDLDTTYAKGRYKVIFRIKDRYSGQSAISAAEFQLGE